MKGLILLILLAAVAGLAASGLYVITPSEQAIITQFGEPIGEPIQKEGLHLKIPFVQKVNKLDRRILEWDGASTPMQTRDKRFIQVDTFARWRIDDPLLFFRRLQNSRRAESRLDAILGGETMKSVARHELVEVVRSTKGREPENGDDGITQLEEIEEGRPRIEALILEQARREVQPLGIELLDIRFKRVNYRDQEVIRGIYERMSSERKQIADQIRSEGEEEASRILGKMDRELKQIESEAYRTVQEIAGEAEAEATRIYASAYNQNAESVAFYEFIRTMEIYENIMDAESTMVLSTDSDLFQFLKGVNPEERMDVPSGTNVDGEMPLFLRN